MKITFKTIASTLLLASLFALSSCSDDTTSNNEENTKQQATKSMKIDFKAMFNDEELMCSKGGEAVKYQKKNSTLTNITLRDFRLFISDVYLIDEEGKKEMLKLTPNDFQYQDENGSVVLLDFENNTGNCIDRKNTPAMNRVAVGEIADKNYSKIVFTLGVPFSSNHKEYPNVKVLNQPGMLWNWQAGRKFTKLESANDINETYVFNLHLGSTGCADSNADGKTDSCMQPNRVMVTLDFDPSRDEVIVDYAKLLGSVDVTFNKGSAPGCMSKLNDPECTTIIPNFGLDLEAKNGLCQTDGCEDQKLFYVDTKE